MDGVIRMDVDAPSPSPGSAPVLVATISRDLRRSVRRCLEDAGYDVAETASVAHTAATLHFARLPHIVVLDFRLSPGVAEPLLHVVALDAALQRHRYILLLAKPMRRVSQDTRRLIQAICAEVVSIPIDQVAMLAVAKRAEAYLSEEVVMRSTS